MTLNKINKLENEHDNAISYIRLLSMVLIISCHFMQYFEMELAWWLNVGVQIFFTMSGFLYGKKEIDRPIIFFKKNFRKILIPYWSIIIVVSVIHKFFISRLFSWGKVISAIFCVGRIPGMEHLWFVQWILICYLVLPYLSFLKREIVEFSVLDKIMTTIGLFIIITFVGFSFNGYSMNPNRITCFVCGVLLGTLCQEKIFMKWLRIILGLIALISNLVKIYGTYIVRIENNLLFDLFSRYAHGLLGIAMFLLLYWLFDNSKGNVVLRFSDKYSYYIYLVHQIFILGPLSLMKLTQSIVTNMLIICCCIMLGGFLLEKISLLINNIINNCNKEIVMAFNEKGKK